MAIKITQPFEYNINQPLVTKDVINSATDYASGNPLIIREDEGVELSKKYAIGHIVWDTNTKQHYVFNSTVYEGNTFYCWSKPTVSNQSFKLTTIDINNNERLILTESIDIELDSQNITYIPITNQPSDWNTKWNEYYVYINNNFILNTNNIYNSNEIYYLKTVI